MHVGPDRVSCCEWLKSLKQSRKPEVNEIIAPHPSIIRTSRSGLHRVREETAKIRHSHSLRWIKGFYRSPRLHWR